MLGVIGISGFAGVAIGAGVCYLWLRSSAKNRFSHMVLEAKAKANAIEKETELLVKSAHVKMKEKELEHESEFQKRMAEVDARNRALIVQTKECSAREEHLKILEKKVKEKEIYLGRLEKKKKQEIEEIVDKMQHIASFTKEEAKAYILEKVEEQSRAEIAGIVRKYEQEARYEGERKANYILAQATSRFAGEYAAERLISVIHLDNDELKGRIIGKEGRNIKTLEMVSGVDIIIDETPNAIIVSSFNLYRRAIATKTIELLIEDGRIQPARIEEVYQKVCDEFEESM